MKAKFTLSIFLLILIGYGVVKSQTQTNIEDERGKALKEWFDSGSIIVECTIEDQIWVTGKNGGYLCDKAKINKILKGKMKKGTFNLIVPGYKYSDAAPGELQIDVQYPDGYYGPGGKGGTFILSLEKSDLKNNCFQTNNKGVYTFTKFDYFPLGMYINFHWNKTARNYVFSNTEDLYRSIQKYCGVDMGLSKEEKKKYRCKGKNKK